MKAITIIFLGTLSYQAFSSDKCLNLSGKYEFKGFNGQDCSINDDRVMHLSPLDLGMDISPYSIVTLRQNDCKNVEVKYKNNKMSTVSVTSIDLTETNYRNGQFEFAEKKSGTVHSFGTLSYSDKTTWAIGLDQKKDLKLSFYHRSIGLFNGVVPTWERVKMNCILERK